jgi:hypothetical protein
MPMCSRGHKVLPTKSTFPKRMPSQESVSHCYLPSLPITHTYSKPTASFSQHVSNRSESQVHWGKNRTAKQIGFLAPSNTTTSFLPTITLNRLSTPYPVLNAYVLERSSSIPDPLKVTDITCGKCNTFIPIDDSQLYTLKASESAIFVNELKESCVSADRLATWRWTRLLSSYVRRSMQSNSSSYPWYQCSKCTVWRKSKI